MKKNVAVALCAIAIVAGGMLAGCTASQEAGTAPVATPTAPPNEVTVVTPEITIEKLSGGREPSDVSILCVRNQAFLYVYGHAGAGGGPALARFPEQDIACDNSDPARD